MINHSLRLFVTFLSSLCISTSVVAKNEDGAMPPEAVRATFAATVLCETLAEAARDDQQFDAAAADVAAASTRGVQPKGGIVGFTTQPSTCKITYDGPDAKQIVRGLVGELDERRRSGSCSRADSQDYSFVCHRSANAYEIIIAQPSVETGMQLRVSIILRSVSQNAAGIEAAPR